MRNAPHCMAAALLLACLSPAHAANKCTLPGGQVVYQDAACPVGQAAERVNTTGAGTAQPDSPGAQYWQREAGRLAYEDRVEQAVRSREVFIGMADVDAVRAWGRPSKVNTTISRGGQSEQWVYRRGKGAAQYVYVQDGRVTTVQTSE